MVRARNPDSGRGGPRAPTPGTQYTNRTDLQQTPSAVPGQTYGQAGAQLAAQQAIPLPSMPGPPPAQAPGPPPVQQPPPQPGHFGPLDRPTDRPNESLHTGSPSGPGPGPEILGQGANPSLPLINQLRGMYMAYPTEDIRRLISEAGG